MEESGFSEFHDFKSFDGNMQRYFFSGKKVSRITYS